MSTLSIPQGGMSRQEEDDSNPYEPTSYSGKLASLCRDAISNLFMSADGTAYAQIKDIAGKDDGGNDCVRTSLYELDAKNPKDSDFGLWLTHEAEERWHFTPTPARIEEVVRSLRAKARLEKREKPARRVAMRHIPAHVATDDDGNITRVDTRETLFLDLCDVGGHVVRVTADEWTIIQPRYVPYGNGFSQEAPPFSDLPWLRGNGMCPLLLPVKLQPGEAASVIDDWFKLFPSMTRVYRAKALLWLVSAMSPDAPGGYFMLNVRGAHGTGKSNILRMLQRAFDPGIELRDAFNKPDDLTAAAQDCHVLSYDNVSGVLSPEKSDALCRVLLGGIDASRTFYQKRHETALPVKNPVLLDGIDSSIVKGDLQSRTLVIETEPMTADYLTLEDILSEFETLQPRILGALCDALAATMKARQERKRYPGLPRMTDACTWAIPALAVLGFTEEEVREALRQNAADAMDTALNASPLAQAVLTFMKQRRTWDGTATELLRELDNRASTRVLQSSTWPKNPNQLISWLTRDESLLYEQGIVWERPGNSHRNGRKLRLYYVTPSPEGDGMGTRGDTSKEGVPRGVPTPSPDAAGADALSGDTGTPLSLKIEEEESTPLGDEWAAATAIGNIAPGGVPRCPRRPQNPLSAVESWESRGDTPTGKVSPSPGGVPLHGPRITRDGVTYRRGDDGVRRVVEEVAQ